MSKAFSRSAVANAVSQMNLMPVMVEPRFVSNMTNEFRQMFMSEDDFEEEAEHTMHENLCEAYGVGAASADKPFAFANGTAIIPVHGTLINRYGGYYFGYVTGYNFIRRQAAQAVMDEDVERIIFDINSNGGMAAGCFELAAELASIDKPTMAVVDANCYSAAYAIASAADHIAVTPSGGAGSVGVITMHVDLSKVLDDIGIKITIIKAGEHKADGNPFEMLSDEVKADIQADVNATYDDFVNLVATNRNLGEKAVRDTEARCYSANDALAIGLIDSVATPSQAVAAFINGPSGSDDTEEEDHMPDPNATKPENQQNANAGAASDEQLTAARQEGASAERTRIAGIIGCEAAKTRPAMANHIAFNTNMSVADAEAMLAVAGEEKQATTTVPDKGADNGNDNQNFLKSMDKGDHPNVGADNNGGKDNQAEEGDLEASLSAMNYQYN